MMRWAGCCLMLGVLAGVGCGSDEAIAPSVASTPGRGDSVAPVGPSSGNVEGARPSPAAGGSGGESRGVAEGTAGTGIAVAPSTPASEATGNVAASARDAGRDAAEAVEPAPVVGTGVVDPGNAGDGDFTINQLQTQVDLTDRGAPRGRTFSFIMDSTKSAIFDGSDPTLQPAKPRLLTRNIVVYVPAKYVDGTPAPVLVVQDGAAANQGNGQLDALSRALDNLTISTDPARKLPAFVVVTVQNGGNDSIGSERGLEYDTMSDRYARFIQLEVLPAVLADAQIKAAYPGLSFTDDPEGKAAMGCSSGAAAAFTMAWFRPDLFRRVITYSGTFVAQQAQGQPESALLPLGAWEYHSSTNLIANTDPTKPIRAFLNVNGMDNGYTAPEEGHHNWVLANQHMAAQLKAKGYHYRFVTAEGIGHCDGRAWQATLADTLLWVWRGYPTN